MTVAGRDRELKFYRGDGHEVMRIDKLNKRVIKRKIIRRFLGMGTMINCLVSIIKTCKKHIFYNF